MLSNQNLLLYLQRKSYSRFPYQKNKLDFPKPKKNYSQTTNRTFCISAILLTGLSSYIMQAVSYRQKINKKLLNINYTYV